MEYESDCLKCSICSNRDIKLFKLTQQEHLLVDKLFACLFIRQSSDLICNTCWVNLYDVKSFFKKIILGSYRMDEKHINSYNCKCSSCQTKFGGLPLLVDVIEQNEQGASQPQPSTSHDTSPRSPRKVMKCLHCDKTFTHKGDLNKHIRKHTGEQPFQCTICDKKFAHTSNLTRHMRVHSGDRPFSCEFCNKLFSRKDKLDLHKRTKGCRKSEK